MTKINHQRGSLRLLDNMRRELTRDGHADATPWWEHPRFKREQAMAPVERLFEQLPREAQADSHRLISAYAHYMEAVLARIEILTDRHSRRKNARKRANAAYEQCREALIIAGARFARHELIAVAQGTASCMAWLRALMNAMPDDERRNFDDLFEILAVESLPLLEAALFGDGADTPVPAA